MKTRRIISIILLVLGLILLAWLAWEHFFRPKVIDNSRAAALYEQQKYKAAAEDFGKNEQKHKDSFSSENKNKAHYKQGLWDKALEATPDSSSAPAWYDRGNAQFRNNDFQSAIESYKQALRLDPQDKDAKANLELARKKQKHQQQQQQNQQPKPQPQKPEEKKPEEPQKDEKKDKDDVLNRLRALDQAEDMRRRQNEGSKAPGRLWY